jgi:hypothetical protein
MWASGTTSTSGPSLGRCFMRSPRKPSGKRRNRFPVPHPGLTGPSNPSWGLLMGFHSTGGFTLLPFLFLFLFLFFGGEGWGTILLLGTGVVSNYCNAPENAKETANAPSRPGFGSEWRREKEKKRKKCERHLNFVQAKKNK